MSDSVAARARPKGRRPASKKQRQERDRVAQIFEAITGRIQDGEDVADEVRIEIATEINELNNEKGLLTQKYVKGSQKRYYAALAVVMKALESFDAKAPAERQLYLQSLGVTPRKGHTIEHIMLDYLIQYGGGPGTADASRKLLSRDAAALQQARHLKMTADEFAARCGKGEAGLDVLARTFSHRMKLEKLAREGKVEEAEKVRDRISLAARVPIELKASRAEKHTRFVAVISCEEGPRGLAAKTVLVRRFKPFEGLSDADLTRVFEDLEDGLTPYKVES